MADDSVEERTVDLSRWIAPALPQTRVVQFEDEHSEVMDALRAAGYEGDFWFEVRPLNAADARARRSKSLTAEFGSDACHLDFDEAFRFDVTHMIEDARFPVETENGYTEYSWEKLKGRQNKNIEALNKALTPRSQDWLTAVLVEMRGDGESSEKEVEEAKGSLPAQES